MFLGESRQCWCYAYKSYVYDLFIAGSTLDLVLQVEYKLSKQFEMADCSEEKIFLAQEIARDYTKPRLTVCQAAYA